MKITAGIGSIDDYIPFCEAGADELFAGYVPSWWTEAAGTNHPLNRREVLYYNVQLGSRSELEILADMVRDYGVPVTITLNSPFYAPADFPLIDRVMDECLSLGFHSFIIADIALLLHIKKRADAGCFRKYTDGFQKYAGCFRKYADSRQEGEGGKLPGITVHLSGEAGEINHELAGFARQLGVSRIIFQRKCTPHEMSEILGMSSGADGMAMDGEAFLLNEMCQFSGAYCNTFHCDELAPMCRVPYRLSGLDTVGMEAETQSGTESEDAGAGRDPYLTGRGGCGLCALWKICKAGVKYLKIVSRGNFSDHTVRDIRAVKSALRILEGAPDEETYIRRMKEKLFRGGCSGDCYYF